MQGNGSRLKNRVAWDPLWNTLRKGRALLTPELIRMYVPTSGHDNFGLTWLPFSSRKNSKLDSKHKRNDCRKVSESCSVEALPLNLCSLDLRTLQISMLEELSKYQDLYLTRMNTDNQSHCRNIVSLHALNHIFR